MENGKLTKGQKGQEGKIFTNYSLLITNWKKVVRRWTLDVRLKKRKVRREFCASVRMTLFPFLVGVLSDVWQPHYKKTQSVRQMQGTQENALRSLLNVNEEGVYRSVTPQLPCNLRFFYIRSGTNIPIRFIPLPITSLTRRLRATRKLRTSSRSSRRMEWS